MSYVDQAKVGNPYVEDFRTEPQLFLMESWKRHKGWQKSMLQVRIAFNHATAVVQTYYCS